MVVRDGDAIGALLTRMGAQETRLTWEKKRVKREAHAPAQCRSCVKPQARWDGV